MVPNTSDDLPEPETPVNTVSRRFGSSTLTSFRLLTRAPWTRMRSCWSAGCRAADVSFGVIGIDGGDERTCAAQASSARVVNPVAPGAERDVAGRRCPAGRTPTALLAS